MISLKDLPQNPGCYLFKNAAGEIIYIGKAKNLRKRIISYFQKNHPDLKTQELVTQISKLDFIATDNELEAIILETKLIRQHQPKYNLDLKNNLGYSYLQITKETFPRLVSMRTITKDGSKFFGPYQDGSTREITSKITHQLFKIRTCGPKLPKTPCLQFYINHCDAPCIGKISSNDYAHNLHRAALFLNGRTGSLIQELRQEMKNFSAKQDYEKAKERRDQIQALQKMKQTQKVLLIKNYNEHLINYLDLGRETIVQIFEVDRGALSRKQAFRFPSQKQILENFIKQYYSSNLIPDQIIIPRLLEDQKLIENFLSALKRRPVKIVQPKFGTRRKLLEMVKNNILFSIQQENLGLLELKDWLFLSSLPNQMECFDISNIGQSWLVGSMVHFDSGKPEKKRYRRFKIKTVKGQDDFASISEVIKRHYSRLLREKLPLPDLIVIDGGKGQLNAGWDALKSLTLQIPMISLAKKFEEIWTLNSEKPLKLSRKSAALKLLQRIRNEAHRFAVKYHRLIRSKAQLK